VNCVLNGSMQSNVIFGDCGHAMLYNLDLVRGTDGSSTSPMTSSNIGSACSAPELLRSDDGQATRISEGYLEISLKAARERFHAYLCPGYAVAPFEDKVNTCTDVHRYLGETRFFGCSTWCVTNLHRMSPIATECLAQVANSANRRTR
jgi:hypothetical protein